MMYPKNLFSINEGKTKAAIREYENRREEWWNTAEKMYPDIHQMNLRERRNLYPAINAAVGYSI